MASKKLIKQLEKAIVKHSKKLDSAKKGSDMGLIAQYVFQVQAFEVALYAAKNGSKLKRLSAFLPNEQKP